MNCNTCACDKKTPEVKIDHETNMISQLAKMMEAANLEPEARERVAIWFFARFGA